MPATGTTSARWSSTSWRLAGPASGSRPGKGARRPRAVGGCGRLAGPSRRPRPADDLHERVRRSGRRAARLLPLPVEDLVVVHDELDIPFAAVRLKRGGGEGGHNGLRSISRSLGTKDYLRVRVGIGRPPGRMDPADFVLQGLLRRRAQRAAVPARRRRRRRRAPGRRRPRGRAAALPLALTVPAGRGSGPTRDQGSGPSPQVVGITRVRARRWARRGSRHQPGAAPPYRQDIRRPTSCRPVLPCRPVPPCRPVWRRGVPN